MRSLSALEWAGIALGAATQAVWCGVLGSALSAASWPALAVFVAAVMVAAAAAARWAGRDDGRLRVGRVTLAAVVVLATAALLVVGRGWSHPYLGWQIVRDVVFCAGVTVLGVRLSRADTGPDEAFRAAAWAFGALCAVLALTALTAAPVAAPAAAVAVVIVAGGLHVAVLRYWALAGVVLEDDRLPVWPWLLAVAAVLAAVLVVTGLVAALLGAAALHAALSDVLAGLSFAVSGFAWVVAGVLRVLAWLGHLMHLSIPQHELPKVPVGAGTARVVPKAPAAASKTGRIVATVVAAGLAVAAALAVAVFSLRRLSREPARDITVVEERESVRSVTSVTGVALGGLRRRLRSLVRGGGKARTPADEIRLRYTRLEARLARAGSPRAPGVTVRSYLSETASTEDPGAIGELTGLYELARYSARAVGGAQAARFAELARTCRPAVSP